jgi:hypothetical protein
VEARPLIVVERAANLPVAARPYTQEIGDVDGRRDGEERVTPVDSFRGSPSALHDGRVDLGDARQDVGCLETPLSLEVDQDHWSRWIVLEVPASWRTKDPASVEACEVGRQCVREAQIGGLRIVRRQWRLERPVRVTVAARARSDHDGGLRLEAVHPGR